MRVEESDFLLDDEHDEPVESLPAWQILVVDDEPGIHQVTSLALTGVRFKDRPIELLSAYSGAEALRVLAAEPDIAVVLLDVVMETDDAGLRCVREIREQLGNTHVRIILRTGQPGQAPERAVIGDYYSAPRILAQNGERFGIGAAPKTSPKIGRPRV